MQSDSCVQTASWGLVALLAMTSTLHAQTSLVEPRGPNGDGSVTISGELKQWHKMTITLDGPFAHERDQNPNPFTDVALTVTFTHESGAPRYLVPGYFAADGQAANTSASAGTKWRAHLSPDKVGKWNYSVALRTAKDAIYNAEAGGESTLAANGSFTIAPTDKSGRDFRAKVVCNMSASTTSALRGVASIFLRPGRTPQRRCWPMPISTTPSPSRTTYRSKLFSHTSAIGAPATQPGKTARVRD